MIAISLTSIFAYINNFLQCIQKEPVDDFYRHIEFGIWD